MISETASPILRVEEITKGFGAVRVLRGVNLSLGRGEGLGLVGDNGAGKSTLVKIITGYARADSGRIFLEGEEVHFGSVDDARSRGIETVYQDLALIPQLSVYHNLFLNRELTAGGFLGLLNNRRMRDLARQYLDDINVHIPDIDAEAEMLSGGQRQAIAVARASRMQGVKVLLLDEPAAGMNPVEKKEIGALIGRLRADLGYTILVIEHDMGVVQGISDRVIALDHGVKIAEGSFEEVASHPTVIEAYLGRRHEQGDVADVEELGLETGENRSVGAEEQLGRGGILT